MRLGGPAREFAVATTSDELVSLVRDADESGTPVLLVGGGSNLVVGDQGFDGVVVKVETAGLEVAHDKLRVDAGVEWDRVVLTSLDAGLAGLETLSGVPGSTGATPIQNVGAYGTLTSDLLSELTVYDRETRVTRSWLPQECGFGSHRQSVFKHSDRYVILDVTFALDVSTTSKPIRYSGLADRLGIDVDGLAPVSEVREAVLQLRGERGMVLDSEDHDTWSVGSFFINPVLTQIPDKASESPTYPDPLGTKLPAAWLIQNAGFGRGYGKEWGTGSVALSSKHVLAVTNRGGATTAQVMAFAAHIREGVEKAFDISLGPECDLVNCRFG